MGIREKRLRRGRRKRIKATFLIPRINALSVEVVNGLLPLIKSFSIETSSVALMPFIKVLSVERDINS